MRYFILLFLIIALNLAQDADSDLKFELVVPQTEWKMPQNNTGNPVLILWKIKNKTDHKIIVPIGEQTLLQLIGEDGKVVSPSGGSNVFIPYSYQDYLQIPAHMGTYVSAGDFCLYFSEKKELFIGGATARGGFVNYGPLTLGKYKLKCTFITEKKPSNYAKKVWRMSDVWLGSFTSNEVNITIEK